MFKFIKDFFAFSDPIENEVQSKPTRRKKHIEPKETRLTPKEIATKRKEPWVDVISFNVNRDNIRNGFYELDWNDYFIIELKKEGYGYDGDPDEEIVSRWFRDICLNAAAAEGVDMSNRASGIIDVSKFAKGN